MSVCPVCEAPRALGELECETCGHIFEMAAVDGSVVPMAELEPTRAAALEVAVEPAPGLEPTAFAAAGDVVAVEVDPDLEPTVGPAIEVAVETTPDLLPTREAEEDLPSALPTAVRCRYCGGVGQAAGLFCDRCGMRLPRLAGDASAAESPAAPAPTCRSCGSSSWAQGRCAKCGARQPQLD